MDKPYSWKRTDDIEIDLMDLLYRLCGQWKKIAACSLVLAVLLGGYGCRKGFDKTDEIDSDMQGEIVLTEEEEQAVASAVRLESEIEGLETYLENSMLMQIEPYHKSKYIMLYSVSRAKRQELPKITESYLNYLINGGAAGELSRQKNDWKMDKSYLAEMISAYHKTYNLPYLAVADETADSSQTAESLFYVEVMGINAGEAERMARDLQKILEKYSGEVNETAGIHRLALLNSMESITADSGLQAQQNEKRALLSSNKANLKAMTDAFSKEQLAEYQKAAGEKAENAKSEEPEEAVSGTGVQTGIRYFLLGLAAGIFVYGGIYACWYLFSDTVKSMKEMKRLYSFPVYGGILLEKCGSSKAQVLNRIRIACSQQGISKLYAAADFELDAQEKECLEEMSGKLKNWGIDMLAAENAVTDTGVWDSLLETGSVLMVCRMGTTTHRMIDNAMQFYLENGVVVTGAAVFCQKL